MAKGENRGAEAEGQGERGTEGQAEREAEGQGEREAEQGSEEQIGGKETWAGREAGP